MSGDIPKARTAGEKRMSSLIEYDETLAAKAPEVNQRFKYYEQTII